MYSMDDTGIHGIKRVSLFIGPFFSAGGADSDLEMNLDHVPVGNGVVASHDLDQALFLKGGAASEFDEFLVGQRQWIRSAKWDSMTVK